MNYRHAFHAGNFADVLKHAALVLVLIHLRKKETAFAVIDTHGGRGLYDLGGDEARRSGEAETGIARLTALPELPSVAALYRELALSFGPGLYPGSPLFAARLLRPQDRLVAVEKQPDEAALLKQALAPFGNARVVEGDFYAELKRLTPPAERRGAVLIDPPYEAPDDLPRAAAALAAAYRRFATGIFLLWYPAKDAASVAAASGEILNAGVKSLLRVELDIGRLPRKHLREPLTATGLLVVNPPYGFETEMNVLLPFLAAQLRQGDGAGFTLERLAGERT